MGKKNIGGAVLDDLKALPKKILKPYYKNGKLNANKVAIDGIPFVIIFYAVTERLPHGVQRVRRVAVAVNPIIKAVCRGGSARTVCRPVPTDERIS